MVYVGSLRKGHPMPAGKQIKVDRTTPLGNPYEMKGEASRDAVCEQYAEYFNTYIVGDASASMMLNPCAVKEARVYLHQILQVAKTEDVALMCWCKPARCHADTIAAWLNSQLEKK